MRQQVAFLFVGLTNLLAAVAVVPAAARTAGGKTRQPILPGWRFRQASKDNWAPAVLLKSRGPKKVVLSCGLAGGGQTFSTNTHYFALPKEMALARRNPDADFQERRRYITD